MNHQQAQSRLNEMLTIERTMWAEGIDTIAGVDEVGRGPIAGPVVAAAVIFPKTISILGIDDSKKLSPLKRDYLFEQINHHAISVGVGVINEKQIDDMNILQATFSAMELAINQLHIAPHHILVDGRENPYFRQPQTALIKGDRRSYSIAAASIIAKVTRDRLMQSFEKIYPEYGFAKHKGYPTPQHILAVQNYGLCPIHRKTFHLKALQNK